MPRKNISISNSNRERMKKLPDRMRVKEDILSTEESPTDMSSSGSLRIQHTDNQGNKVVRRIARREGKGRSETFEVPTQ